MRHFFFPYANRGASLVHAHVHRKGGKNNWTWCEGQDVLDFEAFFSRVIKIVVFGNLYLFPAFLIFNMWFKFSHSSVESIGILQVYWTFKIFFQYKAMCTVLSISCSWQIRVRWIILYLQSGTYILKLYLEQNMCVLKISSSKRHYISQLIIYFCRSRPSKPQLEVHRKRAFESEIFQTWPFLK